MFLYLKSMYPRNEQRGAPVVGKRGRNKGFVDFSLGRDFGPCNYHLLRGGSSWWEEETGCRGFEHLVSYTEVAGYYFFNEYLVPLSPQSPGF